MPKNKGRSSHSGIVRAGQGICADLMAAGLHIVIQPAGVMGSAGDLWTGYWLAIHDRQLALCAHLRQLDDGQSTNPQQIPSRPLAALRDRSGEWMAYPGQQYPQEKHTPGRSEGGINPEEGSDRAGGMTPRSTARWHPPGHPLHPPAH